MGILRVSFKTWIVVILMGILSSCGQMIPILSTDTELTLAKDQKWSIEYMAVLQNSGSILAQQYESALNQMVTEMRANGIAASWELLPLKANDTNLSYRVSFSGAGYDPLNQYIFQNASAITVDPSVRDQVEFAFDPSTSLLSQGLSNSFTLKSSKVLLTNGELVDHGSVRWVNPTVMMTATVSTSRDLTWLWISLLGVGGVGSIIAGFGVMQKPAPHKQIASPAVIKAPEPQIPVPDVKVKYCPQCGHQNPIEAGFCAQCGSKLP